MTSEENQNPQTILNTILLALKSSAAEDRINALEKLQGLNFSSAAIYSRLEQIALHDFSQQIRKKALLILASPAQRFAYSKINTLPKNQREFILGELDKLIKDKLLDTNTADVIKKRYNFDIVPAIQPTPQPVSTAVAIPQPEKVSIPEKPAEPKAPQPTLLQTLTSEASIKIYLYLGAFFVIAAAAILGAVVPELRLPILIISTLIFGGLSIAIKKRLPQPSFALFIVFSFLLPITANSLEQTLHETLNYTSTITNVYWSIVLFAMTAIWIGGTNLYNSTLFSITAYGAFILALLNIVIALDGKPEIYTFSGSLAALSGLVAVWFLKKWRDTKFALPLFLASQLIQVTTLFTSLIIFIAKIFDPANITLWNLIPLLVWGLASVYYIISNRLYPFIAFTWCTAGVLIPIPFFIAATLDLESLGSSVTLVLWGIILASASEIFHRIEQIRKYSLPFLLAALPVLAFSLSLGFFHEPWLGLILSLVIFILFVVLHVLRTRWWLWVLALLNFVIAYFTFWQLDFVYNLNIFFGYQFLFITTFFLLPDLLLKKDWNDKTEHRLPVRIYGTVFTITTIIVLLTQIQSNHIAFCFAILTAFTAIYSLAYQKAWLGYIPATLFPISILYAIDYFQIAVWLPIFTAVTLLYFVLGVLMLKNEKWSNMLRSSALIVGTITSLVTLINFQENGGWYILVIGVLFIVEMILSKDGWFEIGAPILFSIGAFLILYDFNIENVSVHLLTYSGIWILSDLFTHLLYKNPRPLSALIRLIAGALTILNYLYLVYETPTFAAISFAIYTLLFLTVSLLYRQPNLLYTFTLTLPLFATFLFRIFDFTKWIHPVMVVATAYYALGFLLRLSQRLKGWDLTLLNSGLGLGLFVSFIAPIVGGVDAAIPVAAAATFWAFEAFTKRDAVLAFPANGLYLLAYFILLYQLNVQEIQFFSIGAALLGLIQHYLLTRAGSKTGAFIMGMISQFVLLGTTYFEMINKDSLLYFFLLFIQSMAVLLYGITIRSRSLTFFPIGFVVLGVITVVYSALKALATILVIGCAGISLLMLGVLAVLLRERIAKLSEKISDWKA